MKGVHMTMQLSAIGPVILAVGMLAAACGPAGSPSTSSGSTSAPAAQPTQASGGQATQPTQASAAQPAQASAAPAAAAGKSARGGQLTIATQRDATTFDPTKSQDVYSNEILGLVA